jgi:hypothetical protein
MIEWITQLEEVFDYSQIIVLGKLVVAMFILGHIVFIILVLKQIHKVTKVGSLIIPKLLEIFGVLNIILSVIILILIALP